MISYLLEASICLSVFYSFYWLFLRNEKLLSINRFYLLISSGLSLVLPLLDFKINTLPFSSQKQTATTMDILSNGTLEGTKNLTFDWLYLLGLCTMLVVFGIKLFYLKKRIGNNFSFKSKTLTITETEGKEAYSFLNTVFLGQSIMKNPELKGQVLAHEIAHIKGYHVLDLVYFEILRCIFWFNPFSYLFHKSIQLQHEYIADEYARTSTNSEAYERILLEFTLSKVDTQLVSSFGQHPIQKRLQMINKLNSSIMNNFKPLLAIPLLAILFVGFSCSDTVEPIPEPSINEKLETEVTGILFEEMPLDENTEIEFLSKEELDFKLETVVEELRGALGNVVNIKAESKFYEEMPVEEVLEIELVEIQDKANATNVFKVVERPREKN